MKIRSINKKHILPILVASLGFMMNANAAHPGFYLGGQLGYGDIHQDGFENPEIPGITVSSSSKDTGLAGRVFAGYLFNQYFGLETGYTKFSNATAKMTATNGFETLSAKGTITSDAFDFVGKGIIPINNCFNVYGKLGAAYLREDASATLTESYFDISTQNKVNDSANKIYPTFGLGAAYDITPKLAADLAWNRIQKVGDSDQLASTDFVGLGLIYTIG